MNKLNQSQLNYSCSAGEASVNLYTGRMLFQHPDISMGAGSFAIGISHIYDSQFDIPYNTYMGQSWKLNVQQYIFAYDTNLQYKDFVIGDYIYVDGAGNKHRLTPLKTASGTVTGKYYDTTGLGLTMEITNDGFTVSDNANNKMYFENGRMTKTETCTKLVSLKNDSQNTYVTKIFKYSPDGKLTKVYDDRNSSRYFEFSYYNDVLSSITVVQNNEKKRISYKYKTTNGTKTLTQINVTVSNQTKAVSNFSYNKNGLMTYALGSEDKSALAIQYDDEWKVSKVASFIAAIPKCGEIVCGQPTGPIKSSASFVYSNDNTTVINEKNIAITYFFNANGFTTGIFETAASLINNQWVVDLSNLRTLTKEPKTCVLKSTLGDASTKINGVNSYRYGEYNWSTKDDNCPIDLKEIKDYTRKTQNKDVHNYALGFWIKNCNASKININIKTLLDYILHDSSNFCVTTESSSVWTYVTIPLIIKCYPLDLTTILYELGEMKLELIGQTGDAYISDMRIVSSPKAELLFANTSQTVSLNDSTDVSVSHQGGTKEYSITKDFFLSQEDIFKTYRSKQISPSNYTLTYCNGTKQLANVYDVAIGKKTNNIFSGVSFAIDSEKYTNFVIQITSPDNSVVTKVTTMLSDTEMTSTTQVKKDKKTSEEITVIDYLGKTIRKTDSYNVVTSYTYDAYGNPTSYEICNKTPKANEKIIYKTEYDSNNEYAKNEYYDIGNSRLMEKQHSLNMPLATLNSSTLMPDMITNVEYDSFMDKLSNIKLYNGTSLAGQNNYDYDDNGRLKTLSCNSSYNYNIGYNSYGDISSLKLNNNLLMEKNFDYNANTVTSKYYKNNSAAFPETKITYNKYGNPVTLNEDTNTTVFNYQTLEESASLAKLSSLEDPYDGNIYNYFYDENGNPVKYAYGQSSVDQQSESATRYIINGENHYDTKMTLDKEKTISARIDETHISDNDWKSNYGYDSIGRINKVKTQTAAKTNNEYVINNYVYRQNSPLIHSDEFVFANENENNVRYSLLTTYSYDSRGNPTYRYNTNGITNMEYNNINQLTYEKNAYFGTEKSYTYSFEGRVSTETDITNNAVKQFNYTNGRLTSLTGAGSFAYDNIGNPTTYKGQSAVWTRGNLLSSYNGTSFSYNSMNFRFKKVLSSGLVKMYHLDGSKVLGEDWYDNNGSVGTRIRYFYNLTGITAFKMRRKGESSFVYYNYVKDIFGNITHIYKGNTLQAEYTYNAWGECKTITNVDDIAHINPFRWKSYYFDTEVNFYYINGRYYDPTICAYINADLPESIITNAGEVYALNSYSISTTNPFAVVTNRDNFFTTNPLSPNPEFEYTWWEKWGPLVLFGVGLIISSIVAFFVAPLAPIISTALVHAGTAAWLADAIAAGVSLAIVMAVTGFVTGGLSSYMTGQNALVGAMTGFAIGAITGFVTGFAISAISSAISAIASKIKIPNECFIAGTLVLTKDGNKPIEDIQAGDKVWSHNEQTGESDWKEVVQVFRNVSSFATSVEIQAEDGTVDKLVSTPGHKYYLPFNEDCRDANERLEHAGYVELSDKWVSAKDLKKGDKVVLASADSLTGKPKYGIVISVKTEECEEFTTYNFEVEDFHTYYVGKNGVCTHNANCGVGGKGWEGDPTWKANVKQVGEGGTITELKGGIPTQTQAEKLVLQSKGTLLRAEAAHALPNPHIYSHINYTTSTGVRGALRILDPFIPMIY